VSFADFSVAFQHAIRGIHGPRKDRDLLLFLAAYLRSPIARYFLFHTSSRWGIERSEVEVAELLKVPFYLPDRKFVSHSEHLMKTVVGKIDGFIQSQHHFLDDNGNAWSSLHKECDELLYAYFGIEDIERILIEDTLSLTIPSILPTRASPKLATLVQSSAVYRQQYLELLCGTLNDWAQEGPYKIKGGLRLSHQSGVGAVVLSRTKNGTRPSDHYEEEDGLIPILDELHKTFKKELGSVELLRGIKIFDRNTLYIFKPLAQRFWTRTSALNDADQIATTILLSSRREIQA
jgi:hypothetical protein